MKVLLFIRLAKSLLQYSIVRLMWLAGLTTGAEFPASFRSKENAFEGVERCSLFEAKIS